MNRQELEARTKTFALHVIKFVSALPKSEVSRVVGYQLLKAGTSIGANYREANRAESKKDFIHKACTERSRSIAIIEKEAAETQYWVELCAEADIGNAKQRRWLLKESGELLAIFTASGRTAKSRR